MIKLLKALIPERLKASIRDRRPINILEKNVSAVLEPTICIDVGASYYPHGRWGAFLKSRNVSWIAVEPNKDNLKYVDTWSFPSSLSVCTTGLSEMGGRQILYVTNVDSGSSLLEPTIAGSMRHRINPDYLFPVKEVEIQTKKLTELVQEDDLRVPVVVKLDTQGTELSILRGAESLLKARIVGIEMESTLLAEPFMKGSGKFWEAASFLEDRGFELLHLNPIYAQSKFKKNSSNGSFTFLNECDAVFVKRRDLIEEMSDSYKVALFALYCTYSFYEEALLFLEESKDLRNYLLQKDQDISSLKGTLIELI